ncbi:hypothetical protein ES702_05962 [subsurface metagenome]
MLYTTKEQTFAGVRLQQTWSALFVLEKVLATNRPDLIIELGTGSGGLSHFFSLHAKTITFDKLNNVVKKIPEVVYNIADIFELADIAHIDELIKTNGKVFLFCDNGDKKREFVLFVPMLKKGDLVFVHDYGIEIHEKDIKATVSKYKLEPVEDEICDCAKTLLRGFRLP